MALPFLGEDQPVDIRLTEQDNDPVLKPILDVALIRERQNQNLAKRNFSTQKQARLERDILNQALRSEGYYGAQVQSEVKPDRIVYRVETGPRYTLSQIVIQSVLRGLPNAKDLGLSLGMPFQAQTVLDAQKKLQQHIETQYCLWQVDVSYDARVFHQRHQAELTLKVKDSPNVTLDSIQITGQEQVDADYLKSKLNLHSGDCFKRSAIEKARLALYQTGLVSTVDSQLEHTDDKVAVTFAITERKHRTVKAGAGYSSDEGPYVSVGWTHRSIQGRAEKLDLNARVSELYRTAEAYLTIPSFRDPKQTLILGSELSEDHLDAFDSSSLEFLATLKRQLSAQLTGSIGTRYKLTEIDDMGEQDSFGLWSFPVSLSYDRRNDHLNPTRGWFTSVGIEPFIDTLNSGTYFFKTTLGASAYHTLSDWAGQPTFAVRASLGSLTGQSIDDIPADERFYAGGGGSVRGYAYQLLGPLDTSDEPIGGRSFAEISLESRWKISNNWGAVAFLDGGNAYEQITPNPSQGLRWAIGTGARYFTDFAPIRFDIAFPLDRRDGIDDSFQFYISIGQAF